MAFIPIPNCAKVTLQWVVAGQIVEITLSFTRGSGWDTPGLALLAQDVKDWFTAHLRPVLATGAVLTNINATDQSSATGPSYDLPVTTGGAGTVATTVEPLNATAAVKFITALRGRSYRGRNYIPSLATSSISSAIQITPVAAASYVAAWAALPTFLTISGSEHVVASRFSGGLPRVVGVATPVDAYAMDLSIDSQRRRLEGRGI